MVSHLINGKYTGDDHFCLCCEERGEHESWTVAEDEMIGEGEGLEVFGTTWSG